LSQTPVKLQHMKLTQSQEMHSSQRSGLFRFFVSDWYVQLASSVGKSQVSTFK